MPAAAITTLVIAALIVAALAFYLTWVVLLLRRINETLADVTARVREIGERTGPINDTVAGINADLREVADGLEDIAQRVEARSPAGQA
jgi:methyl-accepting chemotaxis protein